MSRHLLSRIHAVFIIALIHCVPLLSALSFHHPQIGRSAQSTHAEIESIKRTTLDLQSSPIKPIRYSSREAASIIKNASPTDGLLVISCDASGRGGGSKHDGLAAVLRIRHGVSKLPYQNATIIHRNDAVDLIDTVSRRRAPSRKDSNEVAAISLGMKRAMQVVPPSWRQQVLIVSDSEVALRFYCSDSSSSGGEIHKRILNKFMMESPNGVMFTKIRSSSRGISMATFNIEDKTSWNGIGFIDHDAADYLSAATRSMPNRKLEYSEELENVSFQAVCSLRPEHFEWLENSDDDVGSEKEKVDSGKKYWNRVEVRGSDARLEREKRNERKQKLIMDMLGIS